MNEHPSDNHSPVTDTSSSNEAEMKESRRYSRNRILAATGIILFLFGGFVSYSLLRVSPSIQTPNTAISSLTIEYSFPYQLEVGVPATFSVAISNAEIQLDATETHQRLLSVHPFPNGTPNVPINQAFGSNYDVFAYAQLDVSPATKFDVPTLRQESQSLSQKQTTFTWTLTPNETTQAVFTVTIMGQWKPRGTGNEIDIPLWEYRQAYVVTTPEPFIIQALTTFGSALIPTLTTLGGIGLTIPWILELIRKKRTTAEQSKKESSKRSRRPRT